MGNSFHKELTGSDIHVIHAYEFINAVARVAATGFTSEDIGKSARDLDTNSFFLLTAVGPQVWMEIAASPVTPPNPALGVIDWRYPSEGWIGQGLHYLNTAQTQISGHPTPPVLAGQVPSDGLPTYLLPNSIRTGVTLATSPVFGALTLNLHIRASYVGFQGPGSQDVSFDVVTKGHHPLPPNILPFTSWDPHPGFIMPIPLGNTATSSPTPPHIASHTISMSLAGKTLKDSEVGLIALMRDGGAAQDTLNSDLAVYAVGVEYV